MTDLSMNRRGVLAAGLAFAATPALARAALTTTTIKVGDRDVELTVARPDAPKGVIVFSHGAGSAPDAYPGLFEAWAKAGFLVVEPMHVDSLKHPKHADYDLRAAFPLRIADLAATRAWAAQAAPGLPMAAAGHSYGSLMSMIEGGALDAMLHARDPNLKAVVSFSSAGLIPGLIGPSAYATLTPPFLMITGDRDVLQGNFDDWHDHLRPFETSPAGDKYAWIGKDVDHGLAHGRDATKASAFADAAALSVTFLKATMLADAEAKAALAARTSTPIAEFRRR
ncbi:alpha/beta hydrolase [uncultured Caulobacter sp.]|uniref:alpha/beta hydrolase n=1 Tax=uncultured Caulobacter sp. TaxID=158749 RepID=UPI00262B3B98|nr:alpha/beta hydrolase [uncultured Caulobacter sp.]